MSDDRDKGQDPRTDAKKKFFRWTFDDLVYSQRLFFALLVLLAGILFFNPWVLYNIEVQDEQRDREQTEKLIENSDRNFHIIDDAIDILENVTQKINIGQMNAATRFNVTQENLNRILQDVDEGVVAINRTVVDEASRRANLTQAETEELVDQLRVVYDSVIPEINTTLSNIDTDLESQADAKIQQDNNRKITEILNILRNISATLNQNDV